MISVLCPDPPGGAMLKVTHDDVERVAHDQLGEIFCLTFVKGVDEAEALSRLGALPDEVRPRTLQGRPKRVAPLRRVIRSSRSR